MKNIIVLIACSLLFTQCGRDNIEVYPTSSYDTLGVQWMVIERDNIIYYFQGTGVKAASIYTDLHEEAYLELDGIFKAKLPQKLRFFVWTDWAQGEQQLNHSVGFALPAYCVCHVRASQTLGHEMTHILGCWAGGTPLKTYSRFINEGLAVAFDLSDRDKIAEAKAALNGQNINSIIEIWQNDETTPEDILYPVGGAFMNFLYKKNTPGQFFALIKNQTIEDAEAIYGKQQLQALINECDRLVGL